MKKGQSRKSTMEEDMSPLNISEMWESVLNPYDIETILENRSSK